MRVSSWVVIAAVGVSARAYADPDAPLLPAVTPSDEIVPPLGAPSQTAPSPAAPLPPPAPPTPPRRPDPHVDLPTVLLAPTGWLLPGAVLYSRTSLDTGGGVENDERVGLGDVAEFGVATTDQVRARTSSTSSADHIQPYVTANFRMGIGENRLFANQPAIALGFQKSFERDTDGFKTQIAELTLVASKHLGRRTAVHVGGAFWDASLTADGGSTSDTLHAHQLSHQVRAFGGLQARPFEHAEILVDLSWAPEFCYDCLATDEQAIRLRPALAWGVRYQVAGWMLLESGVRVPNIGDANLLDAQIFGQITFITWGLRHAVDRL